MQIFWINLDRLKYDDFLKSLLKLDKQNIVFTPNPEILLKTQSDEEFKNLINKANYLTPDWIWLYLAFQILDNNNWSFVNFLSLPYFFYKLFFKRKDLYEKYWDRICGSDLTKDLVEYAQKNNIKITIIDLYNPSDAKKVESQRIFPIWISREFPNLKFEYFIYEPAKKDKIIEEISKSNSQILFSTLWMKRQEESVIEIMEKCENIKLWLWIWSSFDYFIGFQKRAPLLWRKFGFEWLYRLITWPRKIDRLKRLYNAIFVFIFNVIKYKK